MSSPPPAEPAQPTEVRQSTCRCLTAHSRADADHQGDAQSAAQILVNLLIAVQEQTWHLAEPGAQQQPNDAHAQQLQAIGAQLANLARTADSRREHFVTESLFNFLKERLRDSGAIELPRLPRMHAGRDIFAEAMIAILPTIPAPAPDQPQPRIQVPRMIELVVALHDIEFILEQSCTPQQLSRVVSARKDFVKRCIRTMLSSHHRRLTGELLIDLKYASVLCLDMIIKGHVRTIGESDDEGDAMQVSATSQSASSMADTVDTASVPDADPAPVFAVPAAALIDPPQAALGAALPGPAYEGIEHLQITIGDPASHDQASVKDVWAFVVAPRNLFVHFTVPPSATVRDLILPLADRLREPRGAIHLARADSIRSPFNRTDNIHHLLNEHPTSPNSRWVIWTTNSSHSTATATPRPSASVTPAPDVLGVLNPRNFHERFWQLALDGCCKCDAFFDSLPEDSRLDTVHQAAL
nr:hypothetical protein HK105_001338 [Polyrhizophydium stewartii]